MWDESRLNTLRHTVDRHTDRQVDRQVVNHSSPKLQRPGQTCRVLDKGTHRTDDPTATYPKMLEMESSRPPGGGWEIFLLHRHKQKVLVNVFTSYWTNTSNPERFSYWERK